MKKLKDKINYHKKLNRNTYHISDKSFNIVWVFLIAFIFFSVFEPVFLGVPVPWTAVCLCGAVVAVTVVTLSNSIKDNRVQAYERKPNYSFLGLYDLTKEKLSNKTDDVIQRNEEVRYITQLLDDIIFPQGSIKQAVCVTGKSGCGKSTILAFLQEIHERDNSYVFYNFSGNYNNLKATLEQEFSTSDIDKYISSVTGEGKKIVFIFDQFERYFFISRKRQYDIRNFITSLCKRNTAIIISLREEYLAEFLREFDLNDLKSNSKLNDEVKHYGLLRCLVGYIKDNENYLIMQGSRRKITLSKWNNEHIKNPGNIHILDPLSNGVAEVNNTGITLFYCENQNNMKTVSGGVEAGSDIIAGKCIDCFGEKYGEELYNRYKAKPLIEQQIIFHMIEFDSKCRQDDDAVRAYCDMGEEDIFKRYFDIQFSSTNDYYNASRIMYLLSMARLHQISMKTDEIEIGLFAKQFSDAGAKDIRKTIDELEKIQLIRRSSRNSAAEYEIAHDYIANACISYCHSNMDRNIRTALDIYISDFVDEYEKNLSDNAFSSDDKNKHYEKLYDNDKKNRADRYYKVTAIVFCVLIVLTDISYRCIFDPWKTMDTLNPWKSVYPIFIPLDLLVCVIYFYQMFDKVFKYKASNGGARNKAIYFVICVLAHLSVVVYPHFIVTEGVALGIIGATALTLLNSDYRESSRKQMRSYGLKCMLMGFTFAVMHIMFFLFNRTFTTDLMILEIIAMALLSGFAHLAHLSKEYLYGRRMDVSVERGKS